MTIFCYKPAAPWQAVMIQTTAPAPDDVQAQNKIQLHCNVAPALSTGFLAAQWQLDPAPTHTSCHKPQHKHDAARCKQPINHSPAPTKQQDVPGPASCAVQRSYTCCAFLHAGLAPPPSSARPGLHNQAKPTCSRRPGKSRLGLALCLNLPSARPGLGMDGLDCQARPGLALPLAPPAVQQSRARPGWI